MSVTSPSAIRAPCTRSPTIRTTCTSHSCPPTSCRPCHRRCRARIPDCAAGTRGAVFRACAVQRPADRPRAAGTRDRPAVCASHVALRARHGTRANGRCGRCTQRGRRDQPPGREWRLRRAERGAGTGARRAAHRRRSRSRGPALSPGDRSGGWIGLHGAGLLVLPDTAIAGCGVAGAGRHRQRGKGFRDSLNRVPNNGWALYGLAGVYRKNGDARREQAAEQSLAQAWAGDRRQLRLDRL